MALKGKSLRRVSTRVNFLRKSAQKIYSHTSARWLFQTIFYPFPARRLRPLRLEMNSFLLPFSKSSAILSTMISTLTTGYSRLHRENQYAKTKRPSVRKISKVRIEHHSGNRRADGVSSLILSPLGLLSEKPPLLKVVGVRHSAISVNISAAVLVSSSGRVMFSLSATAVFP